MKKWLEKREAFEDFVASHKIGKHGLLPMGSRGLVDRASRSEGKRLQDPEKAKDRPLYDVLSRMSKWLAKEREYNHEIRYNHVSERFKYEAEYERDRQLVFEQTGSPKFKPATLERLREILSDYKLIGASEKQRKWFRKRVVPRMGGRLRAAQRLLDKPLALDATKARLSWETSDWFQDLIARSVPEELSEFVCDPKTFAEHKAETSYVVMDQTALWLKVRGEERLVFHESELTKRAQRKKMSRNFKKATADHERREAARLAAEAAREDPGFKDQSTSTYTTGGDKYRLTLVNISGVEHWWDSSRDPSPVKRKLILLVHASEHCKLSDIDEHGNWVRDWKLKLRSGAEKHFKKGESAKGKLVGWRKAFEAKKADDPSYDPPFEIWGQPKAWTDEIIASWIVEFIGKQYGQSLVISDCLSAQWSEPVLLQAWLSQVVWAPLAPDVTSFLAEPDTHEHAQLKAEIRLAKSEVHRAFEHAWANKKHEGSEDTYVPKWGPFEVTSVLETALPRFQAKNPRVPLEGLIKNQFLVFRPNEQGILEKIDESKPWAVPTLPPTRGIENKLAIERLDARADWVDGRPPRPDWEAIDTATVQLSEVPNEMPPEEAENMLEFDYEGLELTEHQKLMLLPPETRIRQVEYPESIRKRFGGRKCGKRKNKWGQKFKKLFVEKGRAKWSAALKDTIFLSPHRPSSSSVQYNNYSTVQYSPLITFFY